jgi:D-beta-D-heptose 7-phosphate kinase / D-beta-D-heptose 1-phosphate adenosyltransferase
MKKAVWTNGCFDILHLGHLRLLEYAKSRGDFLIVGIDSDERVKQLKGKQRPINNEFFRKEMLESIRWVDNVVVFSSDNQLEKFIQSTADLIVVGSDYINKRVIGSQYAKVDFFDRIEGFSTTEIIEKIND